MTRFTVDNVALFLALLRDELEPDGIKVMSRVPDHIDLYLPLVTIHRVGGDSPAPEFYDSPWFNIQCWCGAPDDPETEPDALTAAETLADRVRGIIWTAWSTQRVVPGLGWVGRVRESSAPQEIIDVDRPLIGRYSATYEVRLRPAAG